MVSSLRKKIPDRQYLHFAFRLLSRKKGELKLKRFKNITFKCQYIFLNVQGYYGVKNLCVLTNKLFQIKITDFFFFSFQKSLLSAYFWSNFLYMHFNVLYNYFCDLSFLYKRFLFVRGVGFKVFYDNHILQITIGYSYIVHYSVVHDIDIKVMGRKHKKSGIYGLSRVHVNNVVYLIQNVHVPDVYCAQGIFTLRGAKFFYIKPGKKQSQFY